MAAAVDKVLIASAQLNRLRAVHAVIERIYSANDGPPFARAKGLLA